jgi:hypothetical protein
MAEQIPLKAVKSSGVATALAEMEVGDYADAAYLPPVFGDYIGGLALEWLSGTGIRVTSGNAYVQSLGYVVSSPAAITKLALSLSASTWYHVYLFVNSGVPDVEIVTTAPANSYMGTARSKTGDQSRRYIGSVRTNSSAAILSFSMSGSTVLYTAPEGDIRALSNGVATVETAISVASFVPSTGRFVQMRADNNSSTQYVYFGVSNDTASGPPTSGMNSIRPSQIGVMFFPLDSSQQLTYWFPAATASGLYLSACGYMYER